MQTFDTLLTTVKTSAILKLRSVCSVLQQKEQVESTLQKKRQFLQFNKYHVQFTFVRKRQTSQENVMLDGVRPFGRTLFAHILGYWRTSGECIGVRPFYCENKYGINK